MNYQVMNNITLKGHQRIHSTKASAQTHRRHVKFTSEVTNPEKKRKNSEHSSFYYNKPLLKQKPHWNQSSSTWRHSSHQHGFSKAHRFSQPNPSHSDILKLQIPTTKTAVSCTLGKGEKQPISIVALRNAKQKPSANSYDMQQFCEETRSPIKGRTFELGRESQLKRYIDHRKDAYSPHFTIDNPGHKYHINKKKQIETQYKRHIMAERLKMFTEKIPKIYSSNPGPKYLPRDRHLYNETGLKINHNSFTNGERIDFSKPQNIYPGPQYKIKGFCQKFKSYQTIQK